MEHVTREEFERMANEHAANARRVTQLQTNVMDLTDVCKNLFETVAVLHDRLCRAENLIVAQQPPASSEGVEVQQSIEEMVAAEMIRMGAKPVELKP
jgi:predicted ATP-dependent protease